MFYYQIFYNTSTNSIRLFGLGILEFLYNNHPPGHHGHPITHPSTAFAKGFNAWLLSKAHWERLPKKIGKMQPGTYNDVVTSLHSHHLKDIIYIS